MCGGHVAVSWGVRLEDGERSLVLNGVRHWVRVAGSRHGTVPLVIVHGGPGGMVYTFECTMGPRLEASCTVVYYEQRGSGRSDPAADAASYTVPQLVADLEALRVALGAARVDLLGFSFGAELALEFAAAHPGSVRRVVASTPGSVFGSRSEAVQLDGFETVARGAVLERVRLIRAQELALGEQLRQVWEAVDRETTDRFLFQSEHAARLTRANWRDFAERFAASHAMAEHFEWFDRSPRRAFEVLPQVQAPTLVTCGLFDRNSGVDLNRNAAALIPGAGFVLFERSAHFPDIEEPDRYEAEVRAFLER